jgi:uncharacterized repeat protein (TIGR03843 family)
MVLKVDPAPDSIQAAIQTARQLAPVEANRPGLPAADDPVLTLLLTGEMGLEGLMPWSSNYTFLVKLTCPPQPETLAIYKPGQGERPLWDFPGGMLCYREFVSYLVSQALGWPNIPPTVLRYGPHGVGSVQLFIEAEYEAHYFNMRHISALAETFRQVALFDYVVNNADRKGGHCLKGRDGRLWAIDHGLTFHTDFKLRTVIWEFCDEAIPRPLIGDLERLRRHLQAEPSPLAQILGQFISPRELQAFKRRLERLIAAGRLPELHPGRNVPYPPV